MSLKSTLTLSTLLLSATLMAAPAQAQDRYLGEIFMTGANFCPRGTAEADGQLLQISQNQAVFSLFGTTYGGDGRTTFALPDMRGRFAMHEGQGPGLPSYSLGQKGGSENSALPPNAEGGLKAPGGKKAGYGTEFPVRNPYTAIKMCVVLQGIFPSRN